MQFHIHKKSRMPGAPYSGPACETARVPSGKVYDSQEEAQRDADKLSDANPVGFEVSPYPYIAPERDDYDPDFDDLRARMAEVRARRGLNV